MNFPPLLTKNIIHPIRCRLNKWHQDVSAVSIKIKKTDYASLDELSDLQEKKLRLLCKNAEAGSSYYRDIFKNLNINPDKITLDQLSELPVLDKAKIRNNFDNIINQNYSQEQINKNATGGSSGEPLVFCQSRHSKIFSAALFLRGLEYCGMEKGYSHVKLWGAPTDVANNTKELKSRIWNYLYNLRIIDAFNVDKKLFEKEYLNFLKKPPVLLESYANILYEFAMYLKLNKKQHLSVPSVISSAGVLHDFQREAIQETISENIFNRYGSREFGNIAQECASHTGMHINMERFIIEIDKPDHDSLGEILVTDLENHAFPFIRYKIGDLGKIAIKKCDCGRQSIMFEKVSGRSLDIIKTPKGKMISGEMFPHFFKDYPEIILGQVIQNRINHIEIRLKLAEGTTVKNLEPLINKINSVTDHELKISINTDQEFKTNPTGKYRPVISELG